MAYLSKSKLELGKVFLWLSRGLSIFVVVAWLIILLMAGLGEYTTAGSLVLVILILATLIAWRSAPIGGGVFIILGAAYLIFSMGLFLSLIYILAAFPLFLTGIFFIVYYLYIEKKEKEEEGVDDF